MKLKLSDLHKLRAGTPEEAPGPPDQPVLAIVKVCQPGYVPEGVEVRSRIDDELFTAEIPAGRLQQVRDDPQVASVEMSRNLQQID